MGLSDEKKEEVGKALVLCLISALKEGKLTIEDKPIVSAQILHALKESDSTEDLFFQLKVLARNWPFLKQTIDVAEHADKDNELKKKNGTNRRIHQK
jgi:hypothetical protein